MRCLHYLKRRDISKRPFEETVRRHQTRSKAAEFGANEMRDWWKEKDYLDLINETTITEEKSKDEIVNEIYSTVVR